MIITNSQLYYLFGKKIKLFQRCFFKVTYKYPHTKQNQSVVYSFTEDDQLALDCISPSPLGDFFTGLPYQITVDSSCQKVYM